MVYRQKALNVNYMCIALILLKMSPRLAQNIDTQNNLYIKAPSLDFLDIEAHFQDNLDTTPSNITLTLLP